jgi:hypothetical protein
LQALTAESQAAANGILTATMVASPSPVVNAGQPLVHDNRAMTCLFRKSSGATISKDAQPYERVQTDSCVTGTPLDQTFHSEGALTYGTFQLLLQVTSDGHGGTKQTQPLSVSLRDLTGGTLLAGPATIHPADIPNDGKWHIFKGKFASGASLAAGHGVYLELTTTDTFGWLTSGAWTAFNANSPTTLDLDAASASQGGTADFLTNAAGGLQTGDYPWTIGIIPSAPGSRTASAVQVNNLLPGLIGDAHVPCYYYAALTWAPTSLGAAFDHYELFNNDGDLIAWITNEADNVFADVECHRNTPLTYSIRVVATDGTVSPTGTFSPVVTVPMCGKCDIVLGSNWNPSETYAVYDENPTSQHRQRQYAEPFQIVRPNAAARVIHKIYGRQMPLGFIPVEKGGDVMTRNLVIAANDPAVAAGTVPPGRVMFDTPLALLEDPTLPYIAMNDANGRRWLSTIQASPLTQEEPGGVYYVTCVISEVADTPVPVFGEAPAAP